MVEGATAAEEGRAALARSADGARRTSPVSKRRSVRFRRATGRAMPWPTRRPTRRRRPGDLPEPVRARRAATMVRLTAVMDFIADVEVSALRDAAKRGVRRKGGWGRSSL